jgi:superfamily II DNA or RNA helicase
MSEGYTGVTINPRPYQREALRGLWRSWNAVTERTGQLCRKALLVLPTGTGKTMIFSLLTNHVVKNEDKKVLILAHRDELIRQAADKLLSSTGIDCAIDKASETGHDTFHKVVVGSVQSMGSLKRLQRYHPEHFDYIIVDETHRILADTYQRIMKYFCSAKVLGVTATAMRGDKQSLGKFFEEIAYEYSLKDAINDGWLSPIVAETCPIKIDLRECKVNAGEFAASDVQHAIEPHLEAIAKEIKKKAGDRKTLLFLPLVETSKTMARILTANGIECRSVDGNSDAASKLAREENKRWFERSPRGTALCNSMLLTEGYDQADIDCIVVLRATKSRGLYCQMIGRGTRVLDQRINNPELSAECRKRIIANSAKPDMLILDFLWLTAQHRLCTPASLIAVSEIAEEEICRAQEKGGRRSLEELEVVAESSERVLREQRLADQLEGLKGRNAVSINPVIQALSMFDDKIINWEPDHQRDLQPITDGQIRALDACGFSDTNGWSIGFACKILDTITARRDKGLASPKQLKTMLKYGIPKADQKTFEEAGRIIDSLSKSWKRKGRKIR